MRSIRSRGLGMPTSAPRSKASNQAKGPHAGEAAGDYRRVVAELNETRKDR